MNNLNGDINTNAQRIDDLESDLEYQAKYHGFDMSQPFDKTNCVRIGTEFSTEEWTLKRSDTEIELSDEDANKAKEILLKAIKYGFVAYVDAPNKAYGTLIHAAETHVPETAPASVHTVFVINMNSIDKISYLVIYLNFIAGKWKYGCYNESIQ